MELKDLVLEKDTVIDGDLNCKNITCKGDVLFSLTVKGNINARNINARDINAQNINAQDINARDINARNINASNIKASNIKASNIKASNIKANNIKANNIKANNIIASDIKAGDINTWDIKARDIKAWDINARNINAQDISYYAVCFAYKNIYCKSIKGCRKNSKHFVLDGKINVGLNQNDVCKMTREYEERFEERFEERLITVTLGFTTALAIISIIFAIQTLNKIIQAGAK